MTIMKIDWEEYVINYFKHGKNDIFCRMLEIIEHFDKCTYLLKFDDRLSQIDKIHIAVSNLVKKGELISIRGYGSIGYVLPSNEEFIRRKINNYEQNKSILSIDDKISMYHFLKMDIEMNNYIAPWYDYIILYELESDKDVMLGYSKLKDETMKKDCGYLEELSDISYFWFVLLFVLIAFIFVSL